MSETKCVRDINEPSMLSNNDLLALNKIAEKMAEKRLNRINLVAGYALCSAEEFATALEEQRVNILYELEEWLDENVQPLDLAEDELRAKLAEMKN